MQLINNVVRSESYLKEESCLKFWKLSKQKKSGYFLYVGQHLSEGCLLWLHKGIQSCTKTYGLFICEPLKINPQKSHRTNSESVYHSVTILKNVTFELT